MLATRVAQVDALDGMKVPRQARFYAFFYPCTQLQTLVDRKIFSDNQLMRLLLDGGFCYFSSLQFQPFYEQAPGLSWMSEEQRDSKSRQTLM